jgi:hypothetical protein
MASVDYESMYRELLEENKEIKARANRLSGQRAVLHGYLIHMKDEMTREANAGVLEPDWCNGHKALIDDLLSVLDTDILETVRIAVPRTLENPRVSVTFCSSEGFNWSHPVEFCDEVILVLPKAVK